MHATSGNGTSTKGKFWEILFDVRNLPSTFFDTPVSVILMLHAPRGMLTTLWYPVLITE